MWIKHVECVSKVSFFMRPVTPGKISLRDWPLISWWEDVHCSLQYSPEVSQTLMSHSFLKLTWTHLRHLFKMHTPGDLGQLTFELLDKTLWYKTWSDNNKDTEIDGWLKGWREGWMEGRMDTCMDPNLFRLQVSSQIHETILSKLGLWFNICSTTHTVPLRWHCAYGLGT